MSAEEQGLSAEKPLKLQSADGAWEVWRFVEHDDRGEVWERLGWLSETHPAARAEGLHPPVGVEEEVFSSLGASKAPSSASAGVAETPSNGWQDIASAPKDGTLCLVTEGGIAVPHVVRWIRYRGNSAGGYWQPRCGVPSHWRPLHAPPTDCQTSGGEA